MTSQEEIEVEYKYDAKKTFFVAIDSPSFKKAALGKFHHNQKIEWISNGGETLICIVVGVAPRRPWRMPAFGETVLWCCTEDNEKVFPIPRTCLPRIRIQDPEQKRAA